MEYHFNAEVAKEFGVDEAVFIHNLYWWIRKNEANGRHYINGYHWTYNTMDAFVELFPFWTKRQIERIIRKLKDEGAILVDNFNVQKFDRTQWYALHQTVTSIYANGENNVTERCNPSHQTVTTIPDSKPDINTDSKPYMLFGEFQKVKMTDEQYNKLVEKHGKTLVDDKIAYLDSQIQSKVKKYMQYKDHYATIGNWCRMDGGKGGRAYGAEPDNPQLPGIERL